MTSSESVTMESIDNVFLASSAVKTPSQSSFGPTGKRLDYITWHQHHMYMARMLSEMCGKQEESAGCYVVDQEHYQIASGFSGENTSTTCHHAISIALQKLESKKNSSETAIMYTTHFPTCPECIARILKLNVAKIWYWEDSEVSEGSEELQKRCEKYIPTRRISINF